jgi:two-component system nitrogen regulation sensor histidine kinase NtrY
MSLYKSLRFRIFFAMLFVLVLTFIGLAILTVVQYKEEAKDYHRERLLRKEQNIKQNLNYVLKNSPYPQETEALQYIFYNKIFEIKDIHNLAIELYTPEGQLILSSQNRTADSLAQKALNPTLIEALSKNREEHLVQSFNRGRENYQSSYSFLMSDTLEPIAIVHLPYIADDGFMTKELNENLLRMSILYGVMLLISVAIAYALSQYITRSLQSISQGLTSTQLLGQNQRIEIQSNVSSEIKKLVEAYNNMIEALEQSAVQLAQGEREAAWREMAKQVAHEIKNPLTPMRLSVQSFERKFDPQDPEIHNKIVEFSASLIQQIDTMSDIASAFATYAKLPEQNIQTIDLTETIKRTIEVFDSKLIQFSAPEEALFLSFDKNQLNRIVTNLIKNSLHSLKENQIANPEIKVELSDEASHIALSVGDNGPGISKEVKSRVFEPKFTTKTKGMGLGLAMVKTIVLSYGGTIDIQEPKKGGVAFVMRFPKA